MITSNIRPIDAAIEKLNMRRSIEAGRKKEEKPRVVPTTILPWSFEDIRGRIPNAFLRSALFGVVQRGQRAYLERVQIYSQEGVVVRYTGVRLDQNDLDVWDAVLHAARQAMLGSFCSVTGYSLLKLLRLSDTGKNRQRLTASLSRLNATALYVRFGDVSFEGSLIDKVIKDEESGKYSVRMDQDLLNLFADDSFTLVDWSVRQDLEGHLLAKWLHGYYSSHARPFPVKVETIHKLCGSAMSRMDNFKRELTRALLVVSEACMRHGEPFHYQIKGGLLFVERKPSRSQKGYLVKNKK